MAEPEINAYLTHLAVQKDVSASTQTQALSALLFLYRHVLGRQVGDLGDIIRARKPKPLPIVMTRDEAKAVLGRLRGDKWIKGNLLYGAGLRLMECLRLRVQDVDFAAGQILVRDGKGHKDRVTLLPDVVKRKTTSHTSPIWYAMRTIRVSGGCRLLSTGSRSNRPFQRIDAMEPRKKVALATQQIAFPPNPTLQRTPRRRR
jgi:integrase